MVEEGEFVGGGILLVGWCEEGGGLGLGLGFWVRGSVYGKAAEKSAGQSWISVGLWGRRIGG